MFSASNLSRCGNVIRYPQPIGSMYGIFTYIYHKNQLNVGKYTIHGSYGQYGDVDFTLFFVKARS